jgi:hypothetical protein
MWLLAKAPSPNDLLVPAMGICVRGRLDGSARTAFYFDRLRPVQACFSRESEMKRVQLEPTLSYQSNDAYTLLYRAVKPPSRTTR